MKQFQCLFVLVLCLKFVVGANRNNNKDTVQIQVENGAVQGSLKFLRDGQSYYSFLGIPYAQPPVGELRFKDPVPYKKWRGVLNATQYAPSCVEMILKQITYTVSGQEDCLYLNVFTSTNPLTTKQLLPVMFWIYGGSFREGTSELYGPDYLLKEKVVIVTFNYRLGFFGFLSTEDEHAPGNYGIKDILVALRWVKNNIIKFGGDPNRITLFGESAGAAIIGYMMMSQQAKGFFNAAIMQSGTPLCPWALQLNARKVAFDLGLAMGITTNSSSKLISYLRSVDLPNAHRALIRVNLLNFLEVFDKGGPFGPVLEPPSDTAFLSKDSYKALKRGYFQSVPVLMGVNSQESKYLNALLSITRPTFFLYDISPSSLVRTAMNIKSVKDRRVVGMKIRQYYFKSDSFVGGSEEEFAEYFSDDLFVRPIVKTAQLLSRYVPVYFYVLDYEGDMGKAWLEFGSTYNTKVKGVGHATDLWYLWKPSWHNKTIRGSDETTSKRLVKLWTNFATYGNPTPKLEATIDVKWPKVKPPTMEYLYIGEDLKVGKNFKGDNMRFWDNLYRNYSKGPSGTY